MKVLVGYDGSNASKEAMSVARAHAKAFNAKVHVVRSMESGTESKQEDIKAVEKELEWCKTFIEKEGIACETHLLIRGLSPGEDLVTFAKEKRIDEIIVGVKRRSRVGKMLMGSSAQFVILKAPCPVVCVK
jgi:nucleotide-binding universal stress UspA family protein